MGTQKGKLFELARMYRSYKKNCKEQPEKKSTKGKPIKAKGQHFDEGKAISLTYNLDMYPEVLHDSHQRQTASMSLWDTDHSEAFYVEPFEADETFDTNYKDATDEGEDASLDKIVKGFSSDSEEEDHEDLSDDEEKLGEMSKKIDDMFKSDDDEESDAMTNDVHSAYPEDEMTGTVRENHEEVPDEVVPETDKSGQKSFAYDASDEEFARDIGAILTGQKIYDDEQKKTIGKGSSPSNSNSGNKPVSAKPSASAADDMLDPNKNEHKIFEKIAQSMTYANSYDLGALALEEKFDLMDREIEKQEIKTVLQAKPTDAALTDEIREAEVVGEDKVHQVAKGMTVDDYDTQVPLDNTNGGRLIKSDLVRIGDLILAANGSDSVGGVYIGSNAVLTKGDDGSLTEQPLESLVSRNNSVAVLRHEKIDSGKGALIAQALNKVKMGPVNPQPDTWLKINIPKISLHGDVCSNTIAKDKCLAFNGKINLGTASNDSFQCSESIISAFEKQQVPFVPLMSKEHNGSLKYLGHLKHKS